MQIISIWRQNSSNEPLETIAEMCNGEYKTAFSDSNSNNMKILLSHKYLIVWKLVKPHKRVIHNISHFVNPMDIAVVLMSFPRNFRRAR